ncbi:MAG: hypothetical protein RLZZ501_2153 [Pseudomonadota bacterium]|jgi:hypothetical protein
MSPYPESPDRPNLTPVKIPGERTPGNQQDAYQVRMVSVEQKDRQLVLRKDLEATSREICSESRKDGASRNDPLEFRKNRESGHEIDR